MSEPQRRVTELPYVERRARLIIDTLRFNAETALAAYLRLAEFAKVEISQSDAALGTIRSRARNKMDHIAGNIGNYTKMKSKAMPLMLGIIQACFIVIPASVLTVTEPQLSYHR